MTGAALGLAAIIGTSASVFAWIKWLGVAYLVWIGLQLILSKDPATDVEANSSGQSFQLFKQGFVTSIANPFAVVFFGALFPQFIDPTLPVLRQLLILGFTYVVVDGVILLLWGWMGVRTATALKQFSFGVANKICGGLMIAAAGLLASKDFHPQR
ncbi:MAG: threonine/homoserine/homoserine lactone efflux protein [Yoonia sp.]|jgi:threonine/homoserine/homoserine lactone efflux protein